MSLKTIIVVSIFAGLLVVYVMYMAGEMSKSAAKIEAFQEASEALKTTTKPMKDTPKKEGEEEMPKPDTIPTPPRPTTLAPTSTTVAPTATTVAPTGPPKAPTTTPLMRRDFEKSLFIANKYEEIYGTKIGPEELETLMMTFADIGDHDVITYKMKEMKYKGTDELDTIFQLVDVSERLNTIVNKLRTRAGRLQATPVPPQPPTLLATPRTTTLSTLTTPAPLTPAPTMPLVPSPTAMTGVEPFSSARKYSIV